MPWAHLLQERGNHVQFRPEAFHGLTIESTNAFIIVQRKLVLALFTVAIKMHFANEYAKSLDNFLKLWVTGFEPLGELLVILTSNIIRKNDIFNLLLSLEGAC